MSDENMVEDAEVIEDQQGQQGEEVPGLSYGDIGAAVQIIDASANRGAFRGEELVSVGTVRERFVSFLAYAKSQGEDVIVPPSASDAPSAPEAQAETE